MTRMRMTIAAGALLAIALIATPAAAQSLPPDICATLQQVRGSGPITSNEQLGAMLNRIAWTHRAQGIGLNRKTGGNNCPSPAGLVACDILERQSDGVAWDVFGSAGPGEATTPNCGGAIAPITDPSRPWVAAADPGDTPGPVTPSQPPPAPSGVATADLQQQEIAALLQIIQQLQEQNAALVKGLADVKAAIAAGVKIRF